MPVPDYALYTGWIREDNNKHKIKFGIETNDRLGRGDDTNAILKFNCDDDFLIGIGNVEREKYGYRCDIA